MTEQDEKEDLVVIGKSQVGDILIEGRKKKRQKLQTVSKNLKIRTVYLEAIEQGEFDVLPEGPYAAGFVRTYAEYLGLDASDVVSKFKEEQKAKLKPKITLNMHQPEADEVQPNFNYVLIGVVLVIIIYAIWSSFSPSDNNDEVIIEPDTQTEIITSEDAVEDLDVEDGSNLEKSENLIKEEIINDINKEETDQNTKEQAAVKDIVVFKDENFTKLNVSEDPEKEEIINIEEETEPFIEEVESDIVEDEKAEEKKVEEFDEANYVPQTFGKDNKDDSKIVITALKDSWVEVKNEEKVYLTRILHKGDVFYAPDLDDLVISTGNAGGFTITFDGEEMEPIGKEGHIKKDFPLDEDNLVKKNH